MPDITWPRRRWFVGLVLEPELVPRSMRARVRQNRWPRDLRPCWTFRGAQRLARTWNHPRRSLPGSFEVFGPLGKGDDDHGG